MTDHTHDRNVEITNDGHATAYADVTTPTDPHGTTQVSFHAEAGHLPAGTRRDLVDAVLDLPDVHNSDHLQATVPIGDTESMDRLRERTTGMSMRGAGSSALVDADIPGESASDAEQPRP
jgi:hypothetical protein